MKIPFQSVFMLGIFDNLRDIPRDKISKKHVFALLFFACSIIYISVKIYNLQFHKKQIETESQKANIANKIKSIDNKLRNIKLTRIAKELKIPAYHIENKKIKTYFSTVLNKDSFFRSKDKRYLFKKGHELIAIELYNGKKFYFVNNQIMTKEE